VGTVGVRVGAETAAAATAAEATVAEATAVAGTAAPAPPPRGQ